MVEVGGLSESGQGATAKRTNEVSMTMKQAEVKQSCRFLLHVVRFGTVNLPSWTVIVPFGNVSVNRHVTKCKSCSSAALFCSLSLPLSFSSAFSHFVNLYRIAQRELAVKDLHC
jgi:hypothetical protein